jgi:membrane-bound lytic murein transglycosylase A
MTARPRRPQWCPPAALLFAGLIGADPIAAIALEPEPLRLTDTQLEPLAWTDLDGWKIDDHVAGFAAFLTSCRPLVNAKRSPDTRPIYGALREVCRRAAIFKPASGAEAQAFFEENFEPVLIAKLGEQQGLLTGYFEPVVEGSRFPSPEFHAPLYRRPPDLLVNGQKSKSGEFPNRATVTHRNSANQIEPYYDRAAIENGALDGQHLEICWLRDPFDAFSIQIQGSARVVLEDGTVLRVNYDAHNGHPYTAIGRILIERYGLSRDQMSMERIRQWLLAHPDDAPMVRQTNRAFVFFRITGLSNDGEAVGAQGVPLAPGRSIAVDKVHVYGTPFFIEADLPIDSPRPSTRFRRLMVAQDTGSAIIGPARADLYWGAGDHAGRVAGRIRHQGRFVMLLPRELDMIEAGRYAPLPPVRPATQLASAHRGSVKTADQKARSPKASLRPEPPTRAKPRS